MFIAPMRHAAPSARRAMFIAPMRDAAALRQEGHVNFHVHPLVG
jgi:hypothetical protein